MAHEGPSAPDPQQLPLGMHEGEPLVPVESDDFLTSDGDGPIVGTREPPVCGEWSYDDSELEEPRFTARRIDGVSSPQMKATPIHPIRAVVDSKAMAARAAATSAARPADPARITSEHPTRSLRPTVEALRLAFDQSESDTLRAVAYASALERTGDATAALAVIERAAAAGADAFAMACARASALGALLKYDDAAAALKAAGKLHPDHAELHVQAGILACRRGRWKDAVEPLQKGIVGEPEHSQAHYYLGEALNKADQLEAAKTAYQRAAELDPENWRALKGIGIVLDRLGRSTEAAPWYRRARDAQRG
jgi:Flp pilus assembly protein TadD